MNCAWSMTIGNDDAVMQRMARLVETIRRAIRQSERTHYRIAQDSGIARSQLSCLMTGERGLSVDAVERLADYFALEIILRPKRRRKKGM